MFRIYARGIIFNHQGQVLLIKKNSNQKIAPGQWILPGGATEFGEDVLETLHRELKEEINSTPESCQIVGCKTMILHETHWLGIYYSITGDITKINNLEPEKHSEINWWSLANLPPELDTIDRELIFASAGQE